MWGESIPLAEFSKLIFKANTGLMARLDAASGVLATADDNATLLDYMKSFVKVLKKDGEILIPKYQLDGARQALLDRAFKPEKTKKKTRAQREQERWKTQSHLGGAAAYEGMQQGQHFALAAQDYKGKGKGKGGKGKGKGGKGKGQGCRICGERDHRGNEFPAGIWHGRQDDPADAADARKAEATKEADLQRKFHRIASLRRCARSIRKLGGNSARGSSSC